MEVVSVSVFDEASALWLEELRPLSAKRETAARRLHAMLLGVARAEASRRRGSLPSDIRSDFDDLCLQAANDALAAILGKLEQFRGASRFTTWAYKFAIFEVSVRLRQRAWNRRRVELDELSWERVADPASGATEIFEEKELAKVVRTAVETALTQRQREVFLAVVVHEIPIDVIAERSGSTRGAVYKVLHDARRNLREALACAGFGEVQT